MAKVKLLSQNDVDELVKFHEYLGDLHSKMPRKKFLAKWGEFMGLDEMEQEALYAKELAEEKYQRKRRSGTELLSTPFTQRPNNAVQTQKAQTGHATEAGE